MLFDDAVTRAADRLVEDDTLVRGGGDARRRNILGWLSLLLFVSGGSVGEVGSLSRLANDIVCCPPLLPVMLELPGAIVVLLFCRFERCCRLAELQLKTLVGLSGCSELRLLLPLVLVLVRLLPPCVLLLVVG